MLVKRKAGSNFSVIHFGHTRRLGLNSFIDSSSTPKIDYIWWKKRSKCRVGWPWKGPIGWIETRKLWPWKGPIGLMKIREEARFNYFMWPNRNHVSIYRNQNSSWVLIDITFPVIVFTILHLDSSTWDYIFFMRLRGAMGIKVPNIVRGIIQNWNAWSTKDELLGLNIDGIHSVW